MPTKPPYDPNIHLLDPRQSRTGQRGSNGSTEMDDEALARRLQEEILAEEAAIEAARNNQERERSQERERNRAIDDMEYARRLQLNENDPDDTMRHLQERQREIGINDQLEYARSLQQQALQDVRGTPSPRGSVPRSNERDQNDRMSREQEDAAIARMMAESGESLRDLDLRSIPRNTSQPPPSAPGAHHVSVPAGFSQALMDANPHRMHTQQNYKADRSPKRKSRRSSGGSSSSRSSRSAAPPPPQPPEPPAPSPRARRRHQQQSVPERQVDSTARAVGANPHMMGAGMDAVNPDVAATAPSRTKNKQRAGLFGKRPKTPPPANEPTMTATAVPYVPPPPSKPKNPIKLRQPLRGTGPVPYSVSASRQVPVPNEASPKKKRSTRTSSQHQCCSCKRPATQYLVALDKKYHPDCFRCMGCHNLIDAGSAFAFMEDEAGEKHPLHKGCFSELYGVKCAVCRNTIPAGPDGKVSFVKHPFFDTEQMCPSHAASPGRRCTGCHRFEPVNEPFADLGDVGRVVCFSCCRTVVVDSADAEPLWKEVVEFLDKKLHLPIWPDMREVPILVTGYKSLNEQMKQTGGVHSGSTQIMTRGVCLTEHQSGRKLKISKLKFNKDEQNFKQSDEEEKGFTYFQVPDANKVNPDSSVTCILCLSGLPRDLTASVLAHEATHAWIKLHPRYDVDEPISPLVEEGCAQLVAFLFLSEGLPPASDETDVDGGPSEEKLRQYFKFSIETDNHEIYGEGYRKAATAYSAIGIEALMSHVVLYKEFPQI